MPRRSKDPFGVRVEADLAHEQRQLDVLVVLRLDLDVSTVALQRHLAGGFRQTERISLGAQMAEDHLIGVVRGEAHLLAHRVLELVEAEIDLADVHGEVPCRRQQQQDEETAKRRAPPTGSHHCDCAPSTMSFTMRRSASRRPFGSSRSAYSPSALSPAFSQIILFVV